MIDLDKFIELMDIFFGKRRSMHACEASRGNFRS